MKRKDGSWIEVKNEPGIILVNIADMMERWTADFFVSTVSAVNYDSTVYSNAIQNKIIC